MNRVTYSKNFYVKKNSTLPEIKYPLTQEIRERYDISDDMLSNVAITFSMISTETGLFRIANVGAKLVINNDRVNYPDEEKYTLVYRFKESETSKVGMYSGEFTIDFLNNEFGCGKLKLPLVGQIPITITSSITKTTVV